MSALEMSEHNYCYPDVIVINGEPTFEGNELDILINPTVIVEILSKATLYYDKTEKLDCYLAMESVKEVSLVKEEEMRVEHYAKQTINQWVIQNLREPRRYNLARFGELQNFFERNLRAD